MNRKGGGGERKDEGSEGASKIQKGCRRECLQPFFLVFNPLRFIPHPSSFPIYCFPVISARVDGLRSWISAKWRAERSISLKRSSRYFAR